MRIRKSVGAFIVNKDGKFLLLKTRGMTRVYWDILKGGVKEGEKLENALMREMKEELGTDKFGEIKKLDFSFTFKFPKKIREKIKFDSERVELFSVNFIGDEKDIKVDGREILDFKFVDEDEFKRSVTYEKTREAFERFIRKFKT